MQTFHYESYSHSEWVDVILIFWQIPVASKTAFNALRNPDIGCVLLSCCRRLT